jgi:lysophospholipase L1-like esterase
MVATAGAALLAATARADDKPNRENSAVKPVPREGGWMKRHESFLERARKGDVDVLFLGDSITQGWEGPGKKAWADQLAPLKAANFGIGGDRTEHVLWRITEGKELEGINPKAFVVMIGTNNMASNTAAEIAAGVTAIVKELRRQRPEAKVLLLGIFPRNSRPKEDGNGQPVEAVRDKIHYTNEKIAKLADGKSVFYLDIGGKFLTQNGELTKEIMPDYLHLSEKGYEIWADAIRDALKSMLVGKWPGTGLEK